MREWFWLLLWEIRLYTESVTEQNKRIGKMYFQTVSGHEYDRQHWFGAVWCHGRYWHISGKICLWWQGKGLRSDLYVGKVFSCGDFRAFGSYANNSIWQDWILSLQIQKHSRRRSWMWAAPSHRAGCHTRNREHKPQLKVFWWDVILYVVPSLQQSMPTTSNDSCLMFFLRVYRLIYESYKNETCWYGASWS